MPTPAATIAVRQFERKDCSSILALYEGYVESGSGRTEMCDVLSASFGGTGADHQLWVAESAGRIIGSAIVRHDASVAHLRFSQIVTDQFDRKAVARAIAEMALSDAWERGDLKLVVHTATPANRVAGDLRSMGFEFSREHVVDGEHVLDFYQNFYETPRRLQRHEGLSEIGL